MESRARGKTKVKQETGQSNRQVLGDIGNLEVFRTSEGKQISRPIKRNFHAKQLENEQAATNLVPALEVPANDRGVAQVKKPNACFQNVIVPALDNKVDVASSEAGKIVDFDSESKGRERSCRKVQTLTSILTTATKAAYETLIELENQPVDIDEDDADDELAAIEYLDELYKFYKLTEGESRVSDYMRSQPEINERMRSITVDWLVDVHGKFKLMPETLYLTINIIDRYLSLTNVPKAELQLVGISSMLIACKYEEILPPQIKDFISISDNAYTKKQIISMETDILEKLEWYLSVPTPYVFLLRLIRASVPPDKEMENLAFYLAELGLVRYQVIILYSPSMIAAAAVYSARCTLKRRPMWNEKLQEHAGYCTEQIIDCVKILISLQANAAHGKIQSVYCKFSSEERGYVALLSPPRDILEKFLAY